MKAPWWQRVFWFSGEEPPDAALCLFAWAFCALLIGRWIVVLLTE